MNCRDFDQNWNQLLDSRGRGDGDRARRLREHAESCPSCLVAHRRFEALRQAIEVWASRPEASPMPAPGLADRVVAIAVRPEVVAPGRARPWRPRFALAAAAALLAAFVGPRFLPESMRPGPAGSSPEVRSVGRDLFGGAVDEATAASWQLALLASEPAARLGREMIDASFRPEPEATTDDVLPGGLSSPDSESISPYLLDQMGDALAAGVRPLSSSARRAFGFLRAPLSEKLHRPSVPSADKGA